MDIKNPRICVATQKSASYDTTTCSSIQKYGISAKYVVENKEGLATVYNLAITNALKDDVDCLILVHDDVILEEDPIPKLEKLFDTYDLVGVAGTSKIELKSPALWHILGGGFQGGNLHGCVQHLDPMGGKPKTNFGPYPHRVLMIDGVFMAINLKKMKNMRFDEDCPAKFHFYDLNFSLDCHLNGYKVGVGDILITHESPGLREFTEEWREGDRYFFKKYES